MALPTSGNISFQQINVELKLSPTATISLNDAAVRSLLGKASGAISMQDAYGKSFEIRFTNTVARTSVSIFELMGSPTEVANYVFENNAEINANIASYALRTGVFPAGSTLTIINNSYIRGMGGAGSSSPTVPAGAGGAALYIDYPCLVDNGAGYIYGGGGGGGGFRAAMDTDLTYYIQAGGGGGAGTSAGVVTSGNIAARVTADINVAPAAGTASAGGAGGNIRITIDAGNYSHVYGGNGGSLGAAGSVGYKVNVGAGVGKNVDYVGAAGAAGAAIQRNGLTVTITAGNNTTQIKGAIA